MVCGTTSNAGKSTFVAGLCRVFARRGVRVAPFKAQNMANNSAITPTGHEIGRAQAWQAAAAGAVPEVAMNPVLLKPLADRTSQVVVLGQPVGTMSAVEYHRYKPELLDVVLDALADLRSRFDLVILEGAGSPAEINLLDRDIVNLRVAARAGGVPAVVVGDIDLGGVFAALYGTVALLPDELRSLVKGFVINKLRGDPALLQGAGEQLRERCDVPTIGVLPWLPGRSFDGEDSLVLDRGSLDGGAGSSREHDGDLLDVAVIRYPRIANFTDVDPLVAEPGVRVRLVEDRAGLGRPDLIVLPGSKATVADLTWLRDCGLDQAIAQAQTTVVGICAGYQMLGTAIFDPAAIESPTPETAGLGLLDVATHFGAEKVTTCRTGIAFEAGARLAAAGYQIHHGRVSVGSAAPWFELDGLGSDRPTDGRQPEGAVGAGGAVRGTTLHGVFEPDAFRAAFLADVAGRAGKRFVPAGVSFEALRQARIDQIADAIEAHLDLAALEGIIADGARKRAIA
jgi:adenosylcobyric acid synthase